MSEKTIPIKELTSEELAELEKTATGVTTEEFTEGEGD